METEEINNTTTKSTATAADTTVKRTVLLIGSTGKGKSTLASVISSTSHEFKSKDASVGVTKECKKKLFKKIKGFENLHLTLLDSPGLHDPNISHDSIFNNIAETCYALRGTGINQIIFVTRGRFDQNEIDVLVTMIDALFGGDMDYLKYTTIVRTHSDFYQNKQKCDSDLEKLKKIDPMVGDIIDACNGVLYVDNSMTSDNKRSVDSKRSREIVLNHLIDNCQETFYPTAMREMYEQLRPVMIKKKGLLNKLKNLTIGDDSTQKDNAMTEEEKINAEKELEKIDLAASRIIQKIVKETGDNQGWKKSKSTKPTTTGSPSTIKRVKGLIKKPKKEDSFLGTTNKKVVVGASRAAPVEEESEEVKKQAEEVKKMEKKLEEMKAMKKQLEEEEKKMELEKKKAQDEMKKTKKAEKAEKAKALAAELEKNPPKEKDTSTTSSSKFSTKFISSVFDKKEKKDVSKEPSSLSSSPATVVVADKPREVSKIEVTKARLFEAANSGPSPSIKPKSGVVANKIKSLNENTNNNNNSATSTKPTTTTTTTTTTSSATPTKGVLKRAPAVSQLKTTTATTTTTTTTKKETNTNTVKSSPTSKPAGSVLNRITQIEKNNQPSSSPTKPKDIPAKPKEHPKTQVTSESPKTTNITTTATTIQDKKDEVAVVGSPSTSSKGANFPNIKKWLPRGGNESSKEPKEKKEPKEPKEVKPVKEKKEKEPKPIKEKKVEDENVGGGGGDSAESSGALKISTKNFPSFLGFKKTEKKEKEPKPSDIAENDEIKSSSDGIPSPSTLSPSQSSPPIAKKGTISRWLTNNMKSSMGDNKDPIQSPDITNPLPSTDDMPDPDSDDSDGIFDTSDEEEDDDDEQESQEESDQEEEEEEEEEYEEIEVEETDEEEVEEEEQVIEVTDDEYEEVEVEEEEEEEEEEEVEVEVIEVTDDEYEEVEVTDDEEEEEEEEVEVIEVTDDEYEEVEVTDEDEDEYEEVEVEVTDDEE
ncbi:hypothetical protein DFA_03666 [Cavenderia fasciculata]|uniref:AIG1-type G domain-containing protein n=1 Tax=Cavenderia fasciculata TaxID=261658 RepID=F4PII8_CACFS|nr:uncharacterized protein DFA_03666 [Cavenderia fasciculata]EGG25417.1 hypothetical protein DFA_03666 [Cavenderia fasciculata]|eukprot:XP_004363268.1 hypothetical protein DFA_03666 [Cavenderia fasciculata]